MVTECLHDTNKWLENHTEIYLTVNEDTYTEHLRKEEMSFKEQFDVLNLEMITHSNSTSTQYTKIMSHTLMLNIYPFTIYSSNPNNLLG